MPTRLGSTSALLAALIVACNFGVNLSATGTLGRELSGVVLVLGVPALSFDQLILSRSRLSPPERAACAVALGVCALIALGLGLNFASRGITRGGWILAVSGLGALGVLGGLIGRRPPIESRERPHPKALILGCLPYLTAAALVLGAVGLARFSAVVAQSDARIVEFWALPARTADVTTIHVRVTAGKSTHYQVVVRKGSRELRRFEFALGPGSWQANVRLPHAATATARSGVTAILSENGEAIRWVRLSRGTPTRS